MPSVTLAESAKLCQDQLIAGLIENVITINPFFEVLPFLGIEGNSLAYDRENALGDVGFTGVGDTISATAAATFTQVTSSLTSLGGIAQVNGLITATRSNINDQTAIQLASKAKSAGRQYQQTMITGDGTSNTFVGLENLVTGGQTITAGANGAALSFALLDQLQDSVTDKDGMVDYLLMHARTRRSFLALLRDAGGATIAETVTLPSGAQVMSYNGTPVFRNDYLPINQTQGTESAATTVYAGTLDDGSGKHGISGLTASNAAGITVTDVGESETKDERIWRVMWYCGLANFSQKGLAALVGINN